MRIKSFFFLIFLHATLGHTYYYFFIPPKDWKCVDPKHLSPSVEICFLGKSSTPFKPSINIATEEISIPLSEYIQTVKKIHTRDKGTTCKELGKIGTKAGIAILLELNTKTKFGPIKLLQAILEHEKKAFILTAAMKTEDFLSMSSIFLQVFQSFLITDNLIEPIPSEEKKNMLRQSLQNLSKGPITKKQKAWKEFQKWLIKEYEEMGGFWQVIQLKEAYFALFSEKL